MKTLFLSFGLLLFSFSSLSQESYFNEEWHEKLNSDLEFICYPNPAHTTISIRIYRGNSEYHTVKLIDCFGKVLIYNNFKTENELDITSLPIGNYIVEISNEKSILRERIIIK